MVVFMAMALPCVTGWAGNEQNAQEPPELTRLRQSFEAQKPKYLEPLVRRYSRELERLKTSLTRQQDLQGALAVEEELDKLRGESITEKPNEAASETTLLTDLEPTQVNIGYGSFTLNDPVRVDGDMYLNTINAHAPSRIVYSLAGKDFKRFSGTAGIKDGSSMGSVQFMIYGDDTLLWKKKLNVKKTRQHADFDVELDGVNQLTLEVDALDNNHSDWSYWLSPKLTN
jgi:hypothetical protein